MLDLGNKNTGCPVKFEVQKNNKILFSINMSQAPFYLETLAELSLSRTSSLYEGTVCPGWVLLLVDVSDGSGVRETYCLNREPSEP